MTKNSISTFSRYLYLNFYGILLFIISIICLILSIFTYNNGNVYIAVPFVLIFFICLKGSFSILASWEDKKRKYAILMTRNEKDFRPDTFSEYMEAPCGRLLTKIVLKDLNRIDSYDELKIYKKTLCSLCKKSYKKTKITIHYRRFE